MAVSRAKEVLRHLGTLFGAGTTIGLDDLQLVERFVEKRDEAAFEALIARHGPMVLGVCRRILANPADVDDAFQATFLVLIKRAGSLRHRNLLSPWLYGVAHRVALHARTVASRRPPARPEGVMPSPVEDVECRELLSVLDEEIRRLPERFRLPVVLCYLEGLSHEEAARRLRCPLGTINSRLASARERLRGRLTRRGLSSTDGLLSTLALSGGAPAGVSLDVPVALVHSTVQSALQFAAGSAASTGVVSATAIALAEGVLQTMFLTKLKLAFAAVLAASTIVIGAGVIAGQEAGDKKSAQPPAGNSSTDDAKEKAEPPVANAAADTDLRETLREAARLALSVEDSATKARTLGDIAKQQVAAGDRDAAQVNFQSAVQVARKRDSRASAEYVLMGARELVEKYRLLMELAKSQAETGFGADAIETAQEVPNDQGFAMRSQVLAEIAKALLNAGDFENALKAAASIPNQTRRYQAVLEISTRMIKAGDVNAALQAAELLKDNESKGAFLANIAFTQAEAGDARGARLWADKLDSPIIKSQVLLSIARGMSQKAKGKASAADH